jgi:hypothetical protein
MRWTADAVLRTAGPSTFDQLNRLTAMHAQGALSDQEFAAAKAKLLGI